MSRQLAVAVHRDEPPPQLAAVETVLEPTHADALHAALGGQERVQLAVAALAAALALLLLLRVCYGLRARYRRDWLGADMTEDEAAAAEATAHAPLTYIPACVAAAAKRKKSH